jgi:aryl-alcohol dehydrogenase-like predicted oxidoreductase
MLCRTLPGTDLQLSVIGTGTWAMGGLWWGDDHVSGDLRDERSTAAIQRALDHGINWFDTAPLYGHGHADTVLVKALGDRKREVVIATKVGVRWDNEGVHARSDLSPDHVRADVDASLQRLGLERIDLLQIHWPCEADTPLADTLAALAELQRAGKVRHVGLCNYDADELRAAIGICPIASLQTPYSLLRREFERELRTVCCDLGVGALAYEPLCRGLLTGKFDARARFPESDLRARDDRFTGTRFLRALTVVSRLQLVAQRLGVPVAALALAWVVRQPGMTVAIAGAKTTEQVDQHARAAELVGDAPFWEEVQRIAGAFRG